MTCIVCNGALVEDKGRLHDNGVCGPGGRMWRTPSTYHCDTCGLVYKHAPRRKK